MNDPCLFLPDDISDETAAVIDDILRRLVELWEWRYCIQIRRFHEANQPEPDFDDLLF
jgi:hypothetical protein